MDSSELKQQIVEYCRAKPEIMACYLFGSFATGANRPGSDLDLAFLLASEIAAAQYGTFRDSVIVDLGRLTRLVIHPIIMNSAGSSCSDRFSARGFVSTKAMKAS